MELASDSSLNGDSINQGGLVAQADAGQLVVAGYGHYVDGRGENIQRQLREGKATLCLYRRKSGLVQTC